MTRVDLGTRWRGRFVKSTSVSVLLNAPATRVSVTDGVADGCDVVSLSGRSFFVAADVVIIACGGLESTRLLMLSRSSTAPVGLGNTSGVLGRYYISHLAGILGPFRWMSEARLPGMRYERDTDGVYVRRTLSLRPDRQVKSTLLNFRAVMSLPPMGNADDRSAVLSAAYLAKRFVLHRIPPEYDAKYGRTGIDTPAQHVRNVAIHLPQLVRFAPWWLVRRVLPERKIPSMEPELGSTF